MRSTVRTALVGMAAAATVGAGLVASPIAAGASSNDSSSGATEEYVVAYADGASASAAEAAIARAGGTVVRKNAKVGYAVVRASAATFADRVAAERTLSGAARNRSIGYAPKGTRPARDAVERLAGERTGTASTGATRAVSAAGATAEPLANRQWDMRQIGATVTGSYRVERGDDRVLVGVIDTGLDGSHPDVAPNIDRRLSRNFTTDIPSIDGPCEFAGCKDPNVWDDGGHGTHVGSTIASPLNGLGIGGVAPKVTLVNLRAGQDSGYFFLAPTLDALTYAGDIGVDAVNMSYYTDPWLYNCLDNPADSPAEQREQRTVRVLTQKAINYARDMGVTPISSMGNGATDLGRPTVDETSPDFPPGNEKHRDIDNSCITVPTETTGVIAVSSTGPSMRKAYYSDYGVEQTDISAPGGDYYDSPDNRADERNLVLAAYPLHVLKEEGLVSKSGNILSEFVVKDCKGTGAAKVCGYYQYLQGTSMAAPHATGVAALIISRYGKADPRHGGLTLKPATTQQMLYASAVEHACPEPRLFHYKRVRDDGTVGYADHYCGGTLQKNGFYGRGIVNAFDAVR